MIIKFVPVPSFKFEHVQSLTACVNVKVNVFSFFSFTCLDVHFTVGSRTYGILLSLLFITLTYIFLVSLRT